MSRKRLAGSTTTTVMVDGTPVVVTLDEDPTFAGLRSRLIDINKIVGVKGYILRNATSAVIDLQNPAKLMEYALLSSEAADACQEISAAFSVNANRTVVKGKEIKMLYMAFGANKLSVFMDKGVDHADIFKLISP